MKKMNKTLSNYLLPIILFLPFFMPADYLLPNFANTMLLFVRYALVCIVFILFVKNRKLDIKVVLFALFLLCPVVSVLTNGKQLIGLFSRIVLFNIYIIISTQILYSRKILSRLKIILIPYCLGQCISMFIFYPHGMYTDLLNDHNYYLFAHDNISLFSILPSLAIMAIADVSEYDKIKANTFIVSIVCLLAYMYTKSVTAIISTAFLLIGFCIYRRNVIQKILCSKVPEVVFLVVLLAVLSISNIPQLSEFMQQTFNKTATISGRTTLWEIALRRIKERPLIGYGFEMPEVRMKIFGISHVHNILLQILYNGGFLMLSMLVVFYRRIMNPKITNINVIIRIYILIYAVAAIFDFYLDQYISMMPVAILMINSNNGAFLANRRIGMKNAKE